MCFLPKNKLISAEITEINTEKNEYIFFTSEVFIDLTKYVKLLFLIPPYRKDYYLLHAPKAKS